MPTPPGAVSLTGGFFSNLFSPAIIRAELQAKDERVNQMQAQIDELNRTAAQNADLASQLKQQLEEATAQKESLQATEIPQIQCVSFSEAPGLVLLNFNFDDLTLLPRLDCVEPSSTRLTRERANLNPLWPTSSARKAHCALK